MILSTIALLLTVGLPQQAKLPEVKMGMVQLVFLSRGEGNSNPTREIEKQHQAFMKKLWESRKGLVVGSVSAYKQMKFAMILDADSPETASKILANDPLIANGNLVPEFHTLYCATNYISKGASFEKTGKYRFGMLHRTPDAPKLTPEEQTKYQEGHMANITKMAQDRNLLLAGPLEAKTPFRGIFVFKNLDDREIQDIVSPDPLIKNGILKLTLFDWKVPKGSFLSES